VQKQKPGTSPGFALFSYAASFDVIDRDRHVGKVLENLETRMNTHCLAEQAGFEPAEGY
jgi:hypothetical protein